MDLRNRTVVILGVADRTSIAWAIAHRLLEHGAKVHIGYQQKFYSRVRLLLLENPTVQGHRCDVLQDEELRAFFGRFEGDPIHALVHCIAYGPPEVFTDPPSRISPQAFDQTLSISTHSLLKVAGCAKPFLSEWASIMTLSYQASEQASPFYGLMGVAKAALECCVRYLAIEMGQRKVRVNAISPGPVATPAAMGEVLSFLRNPSALDTPAGRVFQHALERIDANPELARADELRKATALWDAVQARIAKECAIGELITQDDVADCALFLASDLSRKITGQVLHVDCGFSTSRLIPSSD